VAAISTVIIAQDEEDKIARAIRSAAPFSDEVLVVDGGSVDRTRAVAAAAGARVVSRAWSGFARQRNFAAGAARHDWIFWLDSDEVVTPALAREIAAAKPRLAAGRVYHAARLGDFMGARMIREYHPRLYHRGETAFSEDAVHERVVTAGLAAETFAGRIDHFGYSGFAPLLRKFARYAELEAETQRRAGRSFRAARFLYRAGGKFLQMYLLRGLALKGRAGLFCALAFVIYEVAVAAALIDEEDEAGETALQSDAAE